MSKEAVPRLPVIVKIAVALTFFNSPYRVKQRGGLTPMSSKKE